MLEKKKVFQQPKMKVVVLERRDLICTSTTPTFGIKGNSGYDEEDW